MTEWVVTLRNGKRHELEADAFSANIEHGETTAIGLGADADEEPRISWPVEQVVLVQRRNGHLLEEVWPRAQQVLENEAFRQQMREEAAKETRFYCELDAAPSEEFGPTLHAWRHAKGECETCDEERAFFWRMRVITPIEAYQPSTMPPRIVLPPRNDP